MVRSRPLNHIPIEIIFHFHVRKPVFPFAHVQLVVFAEVCVVWSDVRIIKVMHGHLGADRADWTALESDWFCGLFVYGTQRQPLPLISHHRLVASPHACLDPMLVPGGGSEGVHSIRIWKIFLLRRLALHVLPAAVAPAARHDSDAVVHLEWVVILRLPRSLFECRSTVVPALVVILPQSPWTQLLLRVYWWL